jgi:Putative peptidoglycan binding domain/LysM domain
MPTHTVKQGEHLSQIAARYGFHDHHPIWDHPQNAALKAKRKNPNVLFPGDEVFVPDKELRVESRATEARHRFKTRLERLKLRLVLHDINDRPIKGAKCLVQVEQEARELETDGDGRVELEIPRTAQGGRLILREPGKLLETEVPLHIGHLDPIDTPSGQQARLHNLGYDVSVDEHDEARFRTAVEEFQCDHNLAVDGKCGPATQAALRKAYGC